MKRLMADEKCTATIAPMQSVLPTYTRFGMSALLPHKELVMSDDFKILVDGKVCDDLKSREQILQGYEPNSKAVQFDDIKTVKDAKELTLGQDVVYIYHNQIDARGDKLNTENEVFAACEEAERQTGIRKVALSGGVFQNRLLLELVDDGLAERGFEVLKHSLIPPNDGGIALGQAAYGMAYVNRRK